MTSWQAAVPTATAPSERTPAIGVSRGAATPAGVLQHARLYPEQSGPYSGVAFQYNPETINVSHSATPTELGIKKALKNAAQGADPEPGTTNLTQEQELANAGSTIFKIKNVVVDGYDVLATCGRLLSWTYPAQIRDSRGVRLPCLIFQWGRFAFTPQTSTAIKVESTKATITYVRFTAQGKPIRAEVDLTLRLLADLPTKQNPTSGGWGDEQSRTLVSGETLPGVAVDLYGSPTAWRALAEVNAIDDPLRMRPGARISTPPTRWDVAR